MYLLLCASFSSVQGAPTPLLPFRLAVPYHSQVPAGTPGYPQNWPFFEPGNPAVPNGWCTVACIDMLFNYYESGRASHANQKTPQQEIAAVANTNDPLGGGGWRGTMATDARRAVHYSSVSAWPNNPPAYVVGQGYDWREQYRSGLRYGLVGIDGDWVDRGWTIDDLEAMIQRGHPLITHVDGDALGRHAEPDPGDSEYVWNVSSTCEVTIVGHSIVLRGYDDAASLFFFRDPTLGPSWQIDQQTFWDSVWTSKEFLAVEVWSSAISVGGIVNFSPPRPFDVDGTARYRDPLPLPGTGTDVTSKGSLSFVSSHPVAGFVRGQFAVIDFDSVDTSGDLGTETWKCQTIAYDDTFCTRVILETWGALTAASHSFAQYTDRIGRADSDSVCVPRPVASMDPSICYVPRTTAWWDEDGHLYGPNDFAPGFPCPISAQVDNRGNLTATALSVRFFWSDPIAAEVCPEAGLHVIGIRSIGTLPAGASIVTTPVTFVPPTGNSFGEPYYGIAAQVLCPGDPQHDIWPEHENNIACKSVHRATLAGPGEARLSFWAANPLATPAWVATRLEKVNFPPEWSAFLEPAGTDSVLMAPYQKEPRTIVVGAWLPWVATARVVETLYDESGQFLRRAGGVDFLVWTAPTDVTAMERPPRIVLSVSHPDGMTDESRLAFGLPAERRVHLAVFDVRGRCVATLYHGLAPAGTTRLAWDGRAGSGAVVAPGIYLVRLEAGDTRLARKLLRLR